MAFIDLTFGITNLTNNASMQIGDSVYYTNPTTENGFTTSSTNVLIGVITAMESSSATIVITIDCELDLIPPTLSSFIFFSKDNAVNLSSIKGYYGLAKLKNNSIISSELFSVACDVAESSK